MSASLGVIILAGGYSRRMGTDKALLVLRNGQSLISHTAKVAQALSSEILVVTPWPERYRATLPNSIRAITEVHTSSNPVRPNQKPSAGPINGFATGWQHLSTDWCLLLACDLPYLEAAVLQQWWDWILAQSALGWPQLACEPPVQPLVQPSVQPQQVEPQVQPQLAQPIASLPPMLTDRRGGWEPLCGYYHRSCLPSLSRQQLTHQRAFQPWLSAQCIARYDHIPPQMLRNCNTPADWLAVNKSSANN